MANDLFDLFRDKLKSEGDLVATDPHTLNSISSIEEEQELALEKIASLENVSLKVDYSNFSNFVFFNSALDYFNITGEKILNEYPFDGGRDQLERFTKSLDGYQRHLLNSWPSHKGYLHFDSSISASYITIEDVGTEGGVQRGGLLSPGTGSLTIEAWIQPALVMTGSEDIQIIVQKYKEDTVSTSRAYTLFLTGSKIGFSVKSGSVVDTVYSDFVAGQKTYVAAVLDRTNQTGSIQIITGSQTQFPVIVNSASLSFYSQLYLESGSLWIASGAGDFNAVQKNVLYYTGSLDDVMIWKKARTLNDISSSFNVKHYAQKGLVGLWRFNSTGSAFEPERNRIVVDYSGRNLSGRIQNYFSALRVSGTLLLNESGDPVLDVGTPSITDFINVNQTSASLYDRNNDNKLTDYLPQSFFILEESDFGTELLKNFLYVMARQFDLIKLHIDQFVNILKVNYGKYNQTPDELLDVVAKFFGWEFTGNFLNADAFQYLLGKNILGSINSNTEIEDKLHSIKNEFWKRVLLNLNYIYKTKGTRESIKALMRCYGLNDNFVRIKEYGTSKTVGISTERISSEKSVSALGFGSGSLTGSVWVDLTTNDAPTSKFSIETRLRWPLTSSLDIPATQLSGTLWSLTDDSGSFLTLRFNKDSLGSHTGSLILSSSDESVTVNLNNAGIFNNRWQNVSVVLDDATACFKLEVRELDDDIDIDKYLTASLPNILTGAPLSASWYRFQVGATASYNAEYWMQEVRLWKTVLTKKELDDHTLNFQSYGTEDVIGDQDLLRVLWRLNEDVTASLAGEIVTITDVSTHNNTGFGTGFDLGYNQYKKFLNRYGYIASLDFGWSQNKIRIFNSSEINPEDEVHDAKIVSVEFNMIDSLNEDIVQMMSSLDELNERIGNPTNKHRVYYDDLEVMRNTYFKRLQGKLNFTVFADFLKFFDRSFIGMVKNLVPARAYFMGDEFVVESHMLERPKVTYERRKQQETQFAPEGSLKVWSRFGSNKDNSGRTFPLFLTGSGA